MKVRNPLARLEHLTTEQPAVPMTVIARCLGRTMCDGERIRYCVVLVNVSAWGVQAMEGTMDIGAELQPELVSIFR